MAVEALPTKKIKVLNENPRKLFIFSQPKVGKTTLLSGLDNCLILDLEKGSEFIEAMKIKIETLEDLANVRRLIIEKNKEVDGFFYDYIAIDTVTALESLVKGLALQIYNKTPMGANYKGEILSLPNGAGYYYLRLAFKQVYNSFDGLSKSLILIGHIKDASINKNGKDLAARDIQLTGKIKSNTAADMDAIGFLSRDGNQCILSFKTSETDLATGARPSHLRNQDIVLSEYDETTGKFKFHWDKIFK